MSKLRTSLAISALLTLLTACGSGSGGPSGSDAPAEDDSGTPATTTDAMPGSTDPSTTGTPPDDGSTGAGDDTSGGDDDPIVGQPCTSDEECMGSMGLTCVDVLGEGGEGICTHAPCPEDGCPGSSECLDLGVPDLPSVCVPAQNSFCATQCASDLRCALDSACIDAGCCGAKLACPPMCSMSPGACWSNPRCGADCCDDRILQTP